MKRKLFGLALIVLPLTACRTLNPEADHVKVLDRQPASCSHLGEVYADWAWWGVPTEILNVMKNQTVQKGGNAVYLQTSYVGQAYKCPDVVM